MWAYSTNRHSVWNNDCQESRCLIKRFNPLGGASLLGRPRGDILESENLMSTQIGKLNESPDSGCGTFGCPFFLNSVLCLILTNFFPTYIISHHRFQCFPQEYNFDLPLSLLLMDSLSLLCIPCYNCCCKPRTISFFIMDRCW